VISELFVCASREGTRTHVQNAILQNPEKLWALVERSESELFYCWPPQGFDGVRDALATLTAEVTTATRWDAMAPFSRHKVTFEKC